VQAYNKYVADDVDAITHLKKGVSWNKCLGKWRVVCKGKHLGYHATEDAAALAYDGYVKDGVDPVQRREGTASRFKGVTWDKIRRKWKVSCKGKHLGCHSAEEAAARAYNIEAERIGLAVFNVIPPASDADDVNNTAAPAARALLIPAAHAHTHASAGSKRREQRADAATTPAPAQGKKSRLDTSAGAATGGLGGRLVVTAQGHH